MYWSIEGPPNVEWSEREDVLALEEMFEAVGLKELTVGDGFDIADDRLGKRAFILLTRSTNK